MNEKLPDVSLEIKNALSKEIKTYPQTQNWASNLGHPCKRYLTYARIDWDKKPPIDVDMQMIFNGGKMVEKHIVKNYLEKTGYTIKENNTSVQSNEELFKKYKIGGVLDFLCEKNGLTFPVEVKSISQWGWDKIKTVSDLVNSNKYWQRQYLAQLTLYMLAKNFENGLFIFINKQTYAPKHIWVKLDMEYAESLLKKADYINKCVDKAFYPDRIPYEDNICGECPFSAICLPDIKRGENGLSLLDKTEFDEKLLKRDNLEPYAKEFSRLDSEVKEEAKEVGKDFLTQNYIVTFKNQERTHYAVPEDIKVKFIEKIVYSIPKFKKL